MKIPAAVAACAVVLIAAVVPIACGDDDTAADEGGTAASQADGADIDDRARYQDDVDGVLAVVADCTVSETTADGRRYRTTVEVRNQSEIDRTVTVGIEASDGRGGSGPAIDVPAGASDAWAVVSVDETTDVVGEAVCSDYITAITVTLDEPSTGETP